VNPLVLVVHVHDDVNVEGTLGNSDGKLTYSACGSGAQPPAPVPADPDPREFPR